jgi:hypothetical protein
MRTALRQAGRDYRRQALTLPLPAMGWNKRDSYTNMDPRYARVINNLVVEGGYLETRKGYRLVTALEATAKSAVSYNYDGIKKIFCGAGGYLYDCDYLNNTATALNENMFLSDRWFDVFYAGWLYLLNGVDEMQVYHDGELSAAAFTSWDDAIPLDLTLLNGGTAYKNRLFFPQRGSLAFWHTQDAGAKQGNLVKFDLSQISAWGGELKIIIPWTYSSSGAQESQLLFITSEGEVFVYAGENPSEPDLWALRGTYKIPRPLGLRSAIQLGGDVAYISEDGYFLLSQLLNAPAEKSAAFSDAINPVLAEIKSALNKEGWQIKAYQTDNMLIVNVPYATNEIAQHVMNLQTGAWTRFTNIQAACWSELDGKLYFCGQGGLYQAQEGYNDNGKQIDWDVFTAYNNYGSQLAKYIKEISFIFQETINQRFTIYASVDFKSEAVIFQASPPAAESEWDTSEWDKAMWAHEGYAVKKRLTPMVSNGIYFSLGVAGSTNGQKMRLLGIDLFFESGKNLV